MKQHFDAGSEAEALQGFVFSGTPYKKGDTFPHKALGLVEADLRGLWNAGLITFTGKPVAPEGFAPGGKVEVAKSDSKVTSFKKTPGETVSVKR